MTETFVTLQCIFWMLSPSTEKTNSSIISHAMCGSSALACAFCLGMNQQFANHQHPRQTAANGRWSRAELTYTCKFSQARAAAPLLAMTSLQVFRKRAAKFLAARCAFRLRNKFLMRTMYSAFVRGRRLLRRSARSCKRS